MSNDKTDANHLPKGLPRALDRNGTEFTTGALVRNVSTDETFLVRGMHRQDEGPGQVAFASEIEVVAQRPGTMAEVVERINASRDRGHARGGVGGIRHGSGEEDGDSIIWGW